MIEKIMKENFKTAVLLSFLFAWSNISFANECDIDTPPNAVIQGNYAVVNYHGISGDCNADDDEISWYIPKPSAAGYWASAEVNLEFGCSNISTQQQRVRMEVGNSVITNSFYEDSNIDEDFDYEDYIYNNIFNTGFSLQGSNPHNLGVEFEHLSGSCDDVEFEVKAYYRLTSSNNNGGNNGGNTGGNSDEDDCDDLEEDEDIPQECLPEDEQD